MKIETFQLERNQTLYENEVEYNLTESGVHPYTLRELLNPKHIERLLDLRLGYGYTDGCPRLRWAISQWYSRAGLENVLVTSGTAEANFLCLWTLLSPGDELIFVLPNFMQLRGVAESFGITVKPLFLHEEQNWEIDFDELRALVTSRTRMISFSNPNNPTGKVFDPQTMQKLVNLANEHDIYIHSDEIYRGAELNGKETPSFFGLYDKVIVTGGLAKSLAHAGLRIGWIVASPDMINEAMRRQDYTTIGTGILNQWLAEYVMQPEVRERVLSRSHRILRENLAVVQEWVAQHSKLLSLQPPQAGGIAFIRYGFNLNSSDFSRQLQAKTGVFVAAGDWFGIDRHFRIGIGSDKTYLTQALKRIDNFFDYT